MSIVTLLKARLRRSEKARAIYHGGRRLLASISPLLSSYSNGDRGGSLKQLTTENAFRNLQLFLDADCSWQFPSSQNPRVSVIIPVFNRADLTLQCLQALAAESVNCLEVIIIDNASSDETTRLFSRIEGVRYIRNEKNLHFLEGSNQGAALARGEYLLFLNSDTRVMPGSIAAALENFAHAADVGAVGAKLILPDGTLQEAGSIIWRDGTCLGYGRGDAPSRAPYQFRRAVDFCSGAFLLTPRRLFEQLNGFDLDFKPAYYEEVDYCLRLWKLGYKVVYEPGSVIWHYEFASSKRTDDALKLQRERQALIVAKHGQYLSFKPNPSSKAVIEAREGGARRRRVLWIDERIPHLKYGAGYPRAREILKVIQSLDASVTLYPAIYQEPEESWGQIYSTLPREVEVAALDGYGPGSLAQFLSDRSGYYDTIFVSRPETMRLVRKVLNASPAPIDCGLITYDAEALFSNRELLESKIKGHPLTPDEYTQMVKRELSLAEGVRGITTVSSSEANIFREHGFSKVSTLSHAVSISSTVKGFHQRNGILFVGAIHGDGGPNYDAVRWFCSQVLPILRANGEDSPVYVVGYNRSTTLSEFTKLGVQIVGEVPEVGPWFDRCRVFIAPTRFSAGIPLKVVEALSHGIPAVITPLLQQQLGWSANFPALSADSPENFAKSVHELLRNEPLWNKLSSGSTDTVMQQFSQAAMRSTLQEIILYP